MYVAATSEEEAEEMASGLDELLECQDDFVDVVPADESSDEALVYDGINPNSLDFDKAIVRRLAATFAELSAKNLKRPISCATEPTAACCSRHRLDGPRNQNEGRD